MAVPPWLAESFAFSLDLSMWQELGLAFLLGSFVVATLSDLKHLSAQREFLEVWLLFAIGVLGYDIYQTTATSTPSWQFVAIKWGLILLASVLSWERVGVIFRLARADVAALASAAALLTPVLIIIFYVGAKLLALVVGPLLRRGRPHWPFMPVVSLATVGVLAVGLFV